MTEETLLNEVKTSLSITGNFHDETIKNYIFEVLEYMEDAGVPAEVLKSDSIIGTVARGVSDLWAFGVGGCLSAYFMQRVTQLSYKKGE